MKQIDALRLKLIDKIGGLTIYDTLKRYRSEQYLPAKELGAIRLNKLDQLFALARKSTSYYSTFSSFDELPVLNKKIINQDPPAFLSNSYRDKLIKKCTSGSSGTPFIYYTSLQGQSNLWAGLLLSWESAGYRFGEKVAFVAGNALIKKSMKHLVFYNLMNIDRYPVAVMTNDILRNYVETIRKKKTTIIYGYVMAINNMADYLLNNNIKAPSTLKAIVCTSEMLSEKARTNIEKAFGVKVYNQYGCNEAGIAAFECEYHKLHIISSRSVFEINDEGNLIGTDLANEADIFMKYDTGDIVELSGEQCSCGRHYPIIKSIVGRSADMITDRTNKKIHSTFFTHLFQRNPSIKQFQVVYDESSIKLLLMVDEQFSRQHQTDYINAIKTNLDFESYDIRINEKFYTKNNLKHSFIIDKRQPSQEIAF
jgi:phenylacetate-CoA ligase